MGWTILMLVSSPLRVVAGKADQQMSDSDQSFPSDT
jgi:hypothetical protein